MFAFRPLGQSSDKLVPAHGIGPIAAGLLACSIHGHIEIALILGVEFAQTDNLGCTQIGCLPVHAGRIVIIIQVDGKTLGVIGGQH